MSLYPAYAVYLMRPGCWAGVICSVYRHFSEELFELHVREMLWVIHRIGLDPGSIGETRASLPHRGNEVQFLFQPC